MKVNFLRQNNYFKKFLWTSFYVIDKSITQNEDYAKQIKKYINKKKLTIYTQRKYICLIYQQIRMLRK